MNLNDNLELFNILIRETSRFFNIPLTYVKKDYFGISILKSLVSKNENFVFKGGTCLSVCFNVINRFSEDIDISYSEPTISVGQRKKIKQNFIQSIESLGLVIENIDNIRSRRIFNRYICKYANDDFDEEKILIEWATQTPTFPIVDNCAQCLIGKYLQSINRMDLIETYGLGEFKLKTITLERTFVDKVFAICDYYLSNKIDRQSRHIYDLYKLSKLIEFNNDLIDLFANVKTFREKLDTCYSVKEGNKISDLLLKINKEEFYKQDFLEKTRPLLYDDISFTTCNTNLLLIYDFLKKHDL